MQIFFLLQHFSVAILHHFLSQYLICTALIEMFPLNFCDSCKPFVLETKKFKSLCPKANIIRKLCEEQTANTMDCILCTMHNLLKKRLSLLKFWWSLKTVLKQWPTPQFNTFHHLQPSYHHNTPIKYVHNGMLSSHFTWFFTSSVLFSRKYLYFSAKI